MIHWTWSAIRPCLTVVTEFFWGEAAYGATAALRHLRWLRLVVCVIPLIAIGLVFTAIAQYQYKSTDSYSYYEGKVLEERLQQSNARMIIMQDDLSKLKENAVASTLLSVKMQSQLDRMQDLLDAGVKVLGAVVLAVLGQLVKGIFDIRLRRSLAATGGRRDED